MSSIQLSTNHVLLLYLGCAILIIFVIFFLRSHSSKMAIQNNQNHDKTYSQNKKSIHKNVLGYNKLIYGFGLAISLVMVLSAFNWTVQEKENTVTHYEWYDDDIISIDPPPTALNKSQKPAPKAIILKPIMELDEEDAYQFEDMEMDEDFIFDLEPIIDAREVYDLPPPPTPSEPDELVLIAEQQPRFPGCEHLNLSRLEKDDCSKTKLIEFIYDHIKYPSIARENNIEGMCVIRFVVEKDGSIASIEVIKDIGGGCGLEAKRVVQLMNDMSQKWIPGLQRGRKVRVQYNLPVRFKLKK